MFARVSVATNDSERTKHHYHHNKKKNKKNNITTTTTLLQTTTMTRSAVRATAANRSRSSEQ